MLRLRLISDFIDYYDHYFDVSGVNAFFLRKSKSGLNRRQIFRYLDNHNIKTIPHGLVKDLYDKYYKVNTKQDVHKDYRLKKYTNQIVVYLDEDIHRGEGKVSINILEAIEKYPNYYASVYLYSSSIVSYSSSYKKLFIGEYEFNLDYISLSNRWRSNCGIVAIVLKSFKIRKLDDELSFWWRKDRLKKTIIPNYSLFSIDAIDTLAYNIDGDGPLKEEFCIDFNIAPQVPKTVVVNEGIHCSHQIENMNDKEKEMFERIKKLKGQEVEFKEILPAKEAAESIKK